MLRLVELFSQLDEKDFWQCLRDRETERERERGCADRVEKHRWFFRIAKCYGHLYYVEYHMLIVRRLMPFQQHFSYIAAASKSMHAFLEFF